MKKARTELGKRLEACLLRDQPPAWAHVEDADDLTDRVAELEAEVATLEAGAVLPRHSKHALVMVEVALQNNTSPLPSQVQAVIAALRRIIRGVTTLEEGMEVSRILTDAGLDYIPDLPAKEDKP